MKRGPLQVGEHVQMTSEAISFGFASRGRSTKGTVMAIGRNPRVIQIKRDRIRQPQVFVSGFWKREAKNKEVA